MARVTVRQRDEDVKEKLQRVRSEGNIRMRLGSRIAARFRRIGLDDEIPELRGQGTS
jgi:hypothetical protein